MGRMMELKGAKENITYVLVINGWNKIKDKRKQAFLACRVDLRMG